jgi:8-oxo-dGTP diphosphatase
MEQQMARMPVLAAGGIVLRSEKNPKIAVVRLRKRNEWVLPKGKLDDGETPRAAAEREVLEETGHDVSVHEFLGTLVYESGGRSKAVHYWRMEANGDAAHELMHDVKAVDWLPLDDAVERLSRGYERAFLANVGPIALQAASAESAGRSRAKQSAPEKRSRRRAVPEPAAAPASAPAPAISEPMPQVTTPDLAEVAQDTNALVERHGVETGAVEADAAETGPVEAEVVETEVAETAGYADEFRMVPQSAEVEPAAAGAMPEATESGAISENRRARSLVRKMRDWLSRAA